MIKDIDKQFWLVLVTLSGLFFRLFRLDKNGLHQDEFFSIEMARRSSALEIISAAQFDVHPPLYYLLLHYWHLIAPETATGYRLFSAFVGSITILIVYAIGRHLYNDTIGLLASFITAFSLYQIHWSQFVRMYALLGMFGALSYYFFIRFVKNPNYRNGFGYVFATSCVLYTHVFGIFVPFAQTIYILVRAMFSGEGWGVSLRKWLPVQIITGVIYLPWFNIIFKNQIQAVTTQTYWRSPPVIFDLIETFFNYSGHSFVLAPLFVFLVVIIVVSHEDIRKWLTIQEYFTRVSQQLPLHFSLDWRVWLLMMWLFLIILTPFILSHLITPIYMIKYTIAASPAFYLLVSRGMVSLPSENIKTILIIVSVILFTFNTGIYYNTENNQPINNVVEYTNSNAKSGTLIITNEYSLFSFYGTRADLTVRSFPECVGGGQLCENPDQIWVVGHLGAKEQIINGFNNSTNKYVLIDQREFHSASHDYIVYKFKRSNLSRKDRFG